MCTDCLQEGAQQVLYEICKLKAPVVHEVCLYATNEISMSTKNSDSRVPMARSSWKKTISYVISTNRFIDYGISDDIVTSHSVLH
jgi:hypothetical protein